MTAVGDYETAAARISEIVHRLDSGEAGLRETLDLVREGRSLIEYCASELEAVSGDLEELHLDELVARLDATSAEAVAAASAPDGGASTSASDNDDAVTGTVE
jgi:exodeoxyribonuclease VII small subunit